MHDLFQERRRTPRCSKKPGNDDVIFSFSPPAIIRRTVEYRTERVRLSEFLKCRAAGGSFRPDAREPDHFAPLFGIFGNEFAGIRGRAWKTEPPSSASLAAILVLLSAALISLLSMWTISGGTFLGARTPYHWLPPQPRSEYPARPESASQLSAQWGAACRP